MPLAIPPFLTDDTIYQHFGEVPKLDEEQKPFPPSWTFAKKDDSGEHFPQAIAHRGYKGQYPENTMGAFRGAVACGSHALETDIHITKDDVVVLSHDVTMKRCFGVDEKIRDHDWEHLSQQRTIREPHEPMPMLKDLLQYMATPGLEKIWLLLDIKIDNDPDTVLRLIAKTISEVPASTNTPWDKRIILGCWAAKFLPPCHTYVPTFPITHIGFSIPYARQFLHLPNISFNLLGASLLSPLGRSFLHDVKSQNRPVMVWTVNDEWLMKWAIKKGLDGVISDEPKKFLAVVEGWKKGEREMKLTMRQILLLAWYNLMVMIFGLVFWWKHGRKTQIPPALIRKEVEDRTKG